MALEQLPEKDNFGVTALGRQTLWNARPNGCTRRARKDTVECVWSLGTRFDPGERLSTWLKFLWETQGLNRRKRLAPCAKITVKSLPSKFLETKRVSQLPPGQKLSAKSVWTQPPFCFTTKLALCDARFHNGESPVSWVRQTRCWRVRPERWISLSPTVLYTYGMYKSHTKIPCVLYELFLRILVFCVINCINPLSAV